MKDAWGQEIEETPVEKKRLSVESPPRPADLEEIAEPIHPKPSTKIANIFAILALLLAGLVVGLYLFWSFADEKVLVVNNSPFPVRTIRHHPTADGVVILTVDLCKNVDVVGKTRTSYVGNGREIFLPLQDEKLGKGCLKNEEVPVLIPKDIAPGEYKVKFRVTYDLNPVKRGIVNEFESKTFTVDPPATVSP